MAIRDALLPELEQELATTIHHGALLALLRGRNTSPQPARRRLFER